MPLDTQPGGSAHYERMSPSLLASEPPVDAPSYHRSPEWWPALYQHVEKRFASLRTWRWSWWRHWGLLAEFFLPRRWIWLVVPNRMWRGNPLNDQIIDSNPLQAVRVCASGLWTGLTSPSRPWFKLGIALNSVELDAAAKAWLEDTEMRLYTVLHQSNYYAATAEMFSDVVVFGTGPTIIYEDDEDVIRCYNPACGQYYLAVGARFTVDTYYTEESWTIAQIVEFAGLENCPVEVVKLWDDGTTESELVVCMAVEPNFALPRTRTRSEMSAVPGRFTYRQVHWLKGNRTDRPLSIRGFHEKPFVVSRWAVTSNDAYGRGPCMDALGDAKQIQVETLRKAEYIEKGVRPPMGADPDMKNEPASIIPGHITYVSTAGQKKGFWSLFDVNPVWLQHLVADIKEVQERINRCLFVDIFMAISRMEGVQPRNELELTKRDLERLQVLGPFIERFEQEYASPSLERVLRIMERRGLLKPMPPSLRTVPLKFSYQSIMRLAQRSAESIAMKDGFVTMGQLSAAAKAAGQPDPMRRVNLDKSLTHYLELNNFPQSCVYTDQEVQQQDQVRAQVQQQAKQEEAVSQLSKPAVDAAKVLSQTPVGGGSYLASMLGGGVQPQ